MPTFAPPTFVVVSAVAAGDYYLQENSCETAQEEIVELINKKICMGRDIGVHGNVFGGILMAWIDEAAGAYASEYCKTPNLVTLRVGEMLFKKPLRAGNHLRIYGQVTHVGKTSITLNIEARKYNLYSSDETVVCTTSVTFVRIDDDGVPTAISESIRQRYQLTEKTGAELN